MKKSSKFIFFILLIIFFDSNLFSATIGSDDFADGTLKGWSGTGVSVVSQQLHILGTYSATKTYSFGSADANKSVAINLQATTVGGWTTNKDDLKITANGTQYTKKYVDGTYNFSTIFVTLDGNGNLTLAINPNTAASGNTAASSKTIDIDNIDIYDDPDNSTKVHFDFSNPNLRDFTLYHQDSIVGDMQIIGNSVKLDTGGTCAPLDVSNNNLTTVYADIDSDPNTYNSTSADLVLPPEVTSSNILYALLYWQGRTTGSSDVNNSKMVKIKPFGASSYHPITTLNTKFNWNNGDYQGSADVTALIKTSIDNISPAIINLTGYNKPLWVADVYAPVTSNGYGAWSLVIAYKDLSAKLRNISVYDGYQGVYNNTYSTTLGGFLTPRYGPVDSKFLVFAGEGDISLLTDSVSIADKNGNLISLGENIFRSAEDIFGVNVTNRNPACANTIGTDIRTFSVGTTGAPAIMGNSQTSTTVKLVSTGDEYFPGLFVFSTELYQPDICYDEELTFNGQKISHTNQPLIGAQISVEVAITNKQYESAKGVSVEKIFSPYDGLIYIPGSTNIAPIPGTTYPDVNLTDAIGDDTAEFSTDTNTSTYFLGTGATATQGGLLALGDYTNIKYQAKISDENVSENRYLVSYRNDFLNLSFSGVPLRKCSDFNNEFSAYAPVNIFNVVHSPFTGGTIDPLNNKDLQNALYTQVVNRPFKVDVLALDLDKTTLMLYTGDLNISIIKTPKYTNCADDICKQLICDDEVPITAWQDVPFNNQDKVRDIGFTFPTAIQDASFKVRYTDTSNNVLYVCSRDRFAVRPDRFILTTGEDRELLTSAKDYNFTLIAAQYGSSTVASTDYNVSNVNASVFDLNQTLYLKNGTIGRDMNGTLNFSATPFNIINGQSSNDVGINFNDVGQVDINLTDKTWAQIDIDNNNTPTDCSSAGAYVCGDINATFIPDHFKLENVVLHDYNDSSFTYVSDDLSMSAYVGVTITAQNFLNNTTLNFSSGLWENPVDVNLSVSAPNTLALVKKDITLNGFQKGVITIPNDRNLSMNIKFNFDRNASTALEPFTVQGGDVNLTAKSTYTSSSGFSKDINGSNIGDQNTTFYYGRVHAPDYRFEGDAGNATIYYEVYCKDCNKTAFNINGSESVDSINWYNNMLHVDNSFGQYNPSAPNGTSITKIPPKSMDLKHTAPHKDKINFNSSSWLIYNPTDFLVEFYGVGTWAGQGDLGKTVDLNVSTIQNKRIDW